MAATVLPILAETDVGAGVQALFALLLVGLIMSLAFEEKLHAKKSVIAGVFAVVCLLLGAAFHLLPIEEVVVGSHLVEEAEAQAIEHEGELHEGGHEINMPVYIPAIDWSVIVILLGSSVFVDVISRSGLFKWLAIKVTKLSRGDPLLLLSYYGVMTVVFSAVLNNVTAMVIVGSLTGCFARQAATEGQIARFPADRGAANQHRRIADVDQQCAEHHRGYRGGHQLR